MFVCLSVYVFPEPGTELNRQQLVAWKFDANTVPVAENRRANLNQGVPTNIAESNVQKKKPALVLNHAAYMLEKKYGLRFSFLACVRGNF